MKYIIYCFTACLLFSCSVSKQAPIIVKEKKERHDNNEESIKYNPQTGKYEKDEAAQQANKPKADTIPVVKKETKKIDSVIVQAPVLLKDTSIILNQRVPKKKDQYSVIVLLPFNTKDLGNGGDKISRNSTYAVHFYSGLKMALQHFQDNGSKLVIHVIDCKTSDEDMDGILNRPEVQHADLVIGPYKSNQAKKLIDFVQGKDIVVASPYTTSSNAAKLCPNYIQANPSITRHFECLADDIVKNNVASNVIFLCQNNESTKNRCETFKNIVLKKFNDPAVKSITEIVLPDNFVTSSDFKLDSTIIKNEPISFVIPSWDERYIKDVLRKIENDRAGKPVTVYGMPQWQYMEDLKSYFVSLNAKISSNVFLDPNGPYVTKFRNDYFDIYSKPPDLDAFVGYDMANYFIQNLLDYGSNFQSKCKEESELVTRFNIKPIMDDDPNKNLIDYYENFGLQILKYGWAGFQTE